MEEAVQKESRINDWSPAKILEFLKGGKGRKLVVALGVAGIGLILLSEFWPQTSKEAVAKASAEEFVTKTEEKLMAIIGSIEGAGTCQVMVTLENGVEYVYASQQKLNTDRVEDQSGNSNKVSQRDDSEKSIIVVDTDEGRKGLLVTEIQPTVKGVVIVCEGGDQPLVRQRIVDTVTTALNISSQRVCVTKKS